MLIRIVDGNVVQHVCTQCAKENDIPTEDATWAKAGWCFICGWVPGADVDNEGRRRSALRHLDLTGTEAEGR